MLKPNIERLLDKTSEIFDLWEFIKGQFSKDRANIWISLKDASTIRNKIETIFEVELRHIKANFISQLGVNEQAYNDWFYAVGAVNQMGVDRWIAIFNSFAYNFFDFIFQNFVYYETYDSFSENSRDNSAKMKLIETLIGNFKKALEIGPGTGPLLRRLIAKDCQVWAIESDQNMISQIQSRMPAAAKRIIHADFFHYGFLGTYDVVFIESGIFMFTRISKIEIIFEMFYGIDEKKTLEGLRKIKNILNPGGHFLIGIQGLMKKINMGHDYYFQMERTQKRGYCERELIWYRRKFLGKKKIIHKGNQQKPTITFDKFENMAKTIGFSKIEISGDKLWVILTI